MMTATTPTPKTPVYYTQDGVSFDVSKPLVFNTKPVDGQGNYLREVYFETYVVGNQNTTLLASNFDYKAYYVAKAKAGNTKKERVPVLITLAKQKAGINNLDTKMAYVMANYRRI
jgi:hypothetical protein